ncbi:MAG: hypothetical protein HW400_92 [Candidatus Levybacteria bacterium]|nr:hypothetical protein [Candidatus Levybacteria bacterium]
MRKAFAAELYREMKKNKRIWLLTGDLGFGVLENIRGEFPDRFINCGAREQAMLGIACGLALEGKIPFVYSISTFLLNRPFEWIRNYVNHESIPVKLVGIGRDKEYERDEFSHWSTDTKSILNIFPNIVQFWPEYENSSGRNLSVKQSVREMVRNGKPSFVSLRRKDKQ